MAFHFSLALAGWLSSRWQPCERLPDRRLPRVNVGGAIGGSWETVDARPLAGQRITALLTDARGVLWVGTEERGLASWDGENWRTYGSADGLPDNRIVALFADREGRLWVSTGTGLGYLPADGGPFRRIGLNGLRTLPILAFAQTADGSILFGGISGLQAWRADDALQQTPEMDGQRVLALKVGRDGILWAGTMTGLWRGEGSHWQRESSVGAGRITALHESAGGLLYAGGDAAGKPALWQLAEGRWQVGEHAHPRPNGGDRRAERQPLAWRNARRRCGAGRDLGELRSRLVALGNRDGPNRGPRWRALDRDDQRPGGPPARFGCTQDRDQEH